MHFKEDPAPKDDGTLPGILVALQARIAALEARVAQLEHDTLGFRRYYGTFF